MNVTHLECGLCGQEHEARRLLNLCRACGKPLLVRYDLGRAKESLTKESLASRRSDVWRYREVLPVDDDANIVSLGEGWTPLLHALRLGESVGVRELYIKDEEFQSAWNGGRSFDGKRVRCEKTRSAISGKCRRRPGSLRRSCRARGVYLHAARHAACERRRV